MKACIVPGSFDPLTYGHLDIITRAHQLFDKVYVAILVNPAKNTLFTMEERIDLVRTATQHLPNIQVECFEGLLVDYARMKDAFAIVKGLRAVSDFEYEMQMASMNHLLDERIETIFLTTDTQYSYLSSSMVREVGNLGGDISKWVPASIYEQVRRGMKS